MATKKNQSVVKVPKAWLVAGALVLGTVVVAQAVNSKKQDSGINEVRTTGVLEETYTGTVTREAANDKDKEKYVLTTDGGTKYILIGLKKSYEDKEKVAAEEKAKEEKAKEDKAKGKPSAKPSAKPKSSPKADSEDVNSFEQYVGKKVTISGLVVPVRSDNEPKVAKASVSPKAENENAKNDKAENEKANSANKPSISPKASHDPVSGWDYSRLVVKSIAIVQ